MRGRKSVAKSIKEARGTLRPCREKLITKEENALIVSDPPDYFEEKEIQAWNMFGELIQSMGLVVHSDRIALEALTCSYISWKEAYIRNRKRRTDRTERAKEREYKQFIRILSEFGLTPTSKAKIGVDIATISEKQRNNLKSMLKLR